MASIGLVVVAVPFVLVLADMRNRQTLELRLIMRRAICVNMADIEQKTTRTDGLGAVGRVRHTRWRQERKMRMSLSLPLSGKDYKRGCL
jgi:hypothetical protein